MTVHIEIQKSFKMRVWPIAAQRQQLAVDFGCARFAWNAALDARGLAYRAIGRSINGNDCSKALTELKRDPDYAWLNEANSAVITQTLRDQDKAFQRFFKKQGGYPKFKKKSHKQSARYQLDQRHIDRTFDVSQRLLKLPKIGNLKASWPFDAIPGKPKMVTISRDGLGRYYASFMVNFETATAPAVDKTVGVDFGLTDVIALSDGFKSGNPKHLYKAERQLKIAQRRLSRKKKGSKRWDKARRRVVRLHSRVSNRRKTFLHGLSKKIVSENQAISLQTHNLAGWLANRHTSRATADAALSELTRQIEYKAAWTGRTVNYVDRWQRTTGVCPDTLQVQPKPKLSQRQFTCSCCGKTHDRDTAAAIVIDKTGNMGAVLNTRAEGSDRCQTGKPSRQVGPEKRELAE